MNLIDTDNPEVWAGEFVRVVRDHPHTIDVMTSWFSQVMSAREMAVRHKIELEFEDELEAAYMDGYIDAQNGREPNFNGV